VTSGQRSIVPDRKRLIRARAASNMNSNIRFGNLGSIVTAECEWLPAFLIHGVLGWMKTLDVDSTRWKRHWSRISQIRAMVISFHGKAFRIENIGAYVTSSRVPSTSGSGRAAQNPNSCGRRLARSLAKSLHYLVSFRQAWISPK
jgi:hypothetical protein